MVEEIKRSACKYFRHWCIKGVLAYSVLFQRAEIGPADKTYKETNFR